MPSVRQPVRRPPVRFQSYALAFSAIALFLLLAHGPLLRLPFYWDETGQFIPASLDLFHTRAWIPVSTLPNIHPPGLMAYLALVWKISGFSIPATRTAMLLIAALGALVTFLLGIELARGAPGTPAFTAVSLLCISPLFFAQSMLAQLDMPAMSLSILALLLFLQNRHRAAAVVCVFLVLIKETGLIVPVLLGGWLFFESGDWRQRSRSLWFLLPLPGLLIWLFALHHATGSWFGNAAFEAYNLREPLHPIRFLFAVARRAYYLFIGSGHFIGTAALLWALPRMPLLQDRPWRIAGSFVLAQVLVVSALGGAVLERYVLPALPVVYIAFATSMRALAPRTRMVSLSALLACLAAANLINPPYPFPFENNLAFASFVNLEEAAAITVEQHGGTLPGGGTVATAFPVADALREPDFGFVQFPRKVIELNGFTQPEIAKLRDRPPDMLVVYQRSWDPLHLLDNPALRGVFRRYYGYQPELNAEEIAATLSMHVARRWTRRGLSMQLLERSTTVPSSPGGP